MALHALLIDDALHSQTDKNINWRFTTGSIDSSIWIKGTQIAIKFLKFSLNILFYVKDYWPSTCKLHHVIQRSAKSLRAIKNFNRNFDLSDFFESAFFVIPFIKDAKIYSRSQLFRQLLIPASRYILMIRFTPKYRWLPRKQFCVCLFYDFHSLAHELNIYCL